MERMQRQGWFLVLLGLIGLALVGCSSGAKKYKSAKLDPFAGKGSPYYKGKGQLPEGGGKYHVGKPYQVAGRWFTPKAQPNYDKTGMASWYGEAFHARKTSNGEWFDMNDLTAAHPTLPLPSYAKVTNLDNGREVVVRINDRGPFVGTRIIDLSKRTSDALGFRHKGKTEVRVQWIANAPLNDKSYKHLAMMNRAMADGSGIRQLAALSKKGAPSTMTAEAAPMPPAAEQASAQTVAYKAPEIAPQQQASSTSAPAGFVVHVATFANRSNADAAYEQLSANMDLQMFQFQGDDGPLYRLQTRAVGSEDEAARQLYAVQDAGFTGAKIRRVRVQQVAAKIAG
jgi:rare lipoprotein A